MFIMPSRHKPRTYTSSLSDDFLNFRIYGTPITVQFYNMIDNLPPNLTQVCLRQAASICNARHTSGLGDTAVGTHALSYSADNDPESVLLMLSPRPQLTWDTWAKVVDSLFIVQAYNEYKELYFIILWDLSPGSDRVDGVGKMWET